MFSKFANFWIKNWKITFIFILVCIIGWVAAWFLLPKQYNPDITAPAFSIYIPAYGYSSDEVKEYVIKPMENKLYEIEDMEHIYSIADKNYWFISVSYKVWTDKEKATTRLYNKLSDLSFLPSSVSAPTIKSIDLQDIPIYTFAIYKENSLSGNNDQTEIDLKKIWVDMIDELKYVANTTDFYLVGWQDDNINVRLDFDKLEAKNIDTINVYQAIQKNNNVSPWWNFVIDQINNPITIDANLNDVDRISNIVVGYYSGSAVYLNDVATIYQWISKKKYSTFVNFGTGSGKAVYIWIAKSKTANSVTVVNDIVKKLDEIKKTLPAGYNLMEVQNEWVVADTATNDLLIELVKCIWILFVVLALFLWLKDAFSASLAIPLILLLTFVVALLINDNINRITLFALILILWMIVDDSIIVIENISRHLEDPKNAWKKIMDIIKTSVDEIGFAALLSTITKILAFIWIFFVTWLTGQYVRPIPKYAIIWLTISIFIAFAVNPFMSYLFAKHKFKWEIIKKPEDHKKHKNPENSFFNRSYKGFLNMFFNHKWLRILFKICFWGLLLFLMTFPYYYEFLRMRMLPKSNKEQIFLWIDAPRNWSSQRTMSLAEEVNDYMSPKSSKDDLRENIKDISYRVWIAPTLDFANTLRGSYSRIGENNISMRINLLSNEERKITSEQFTIQFREKFQKEFEKKYPDAKFQFLEEPPGPPMKATFLVKISNENYESNKNFALRLKQKIYPIISYHNVVDYYDDVSKYQSAYNIKLDQEMITRLGLDAEQIANTIWIVFEWTNVDVFHTPWSKIAYNIFLGFRDEDKDAYDILDRINFTNKLGKKVYLSEIAKIVKTQADNRYYSEDRDPTINLYGEIWDWWVIYPVANIMKRFMSPEFWEGKYKLTYIDFYGARVQDNLWNEYKITFGGERKLTVDSFRDLFEALSLTLIMLFFLVAAYFKNFKITGVIMLAFLLGFFGIVPWFSLLYKLNNEYLSSTSLIWIIALSWIVIWNWIILIEYYVQLRNKEKLDKRQALLKAWITRLRPIFLTSLTAILSAMMILTDPVWSGLSRALIWGLSFSATLTLIALPIFLFDIKDDPVE